MYNVIRPNNLDRGNIYLSGGMQFAENLGAGWREKCTKIIEKLNYYSMDITDMDISYNKAHGKVSTPKPNKDINGDIESDLSKEQMLFHKATMRKHFVETDLNLIKDQCDALIVFYDHSARNGAGTVSEAQFAYNLNIPIFLVCTDYKSHEEMFNNVSGWLIALSTKHFLNFEDLYEYLENLPYGILKKDIYGNHSVGNKYLCHLSGDVFEKKKHKFVSKIHPLYSQESVSIVADVNEQQKDRYEFFIEYLNAKNKK